MTVAYLQFGQWGGPYQTVMADGVRIDKDCRPNPYALGYGWKIPTAYSILYRGHWRRVYCACYGNIGTLWATVNGESIVVDVVL